MPDDAGAPGPNIMIITCHDIGDYFGCYGTPVPTPNIDSLASDGILFERHFSTATVCSPSRGSIMTGCYPHTNGLTGLVHRGHALNTQSYLTLPTLLSQHGYQTHLFGLQHEHWDPHQLGYEHVHEGASRHVDDVVPMFTEWLRGQGAVKGPFLAALGFIETHRNGMAPSGFTYKSYEPADPASVQVPLFLADIPAVRRELAAFYGAISLVDKEIGEMLRALDDKGLSENTLVIFTSDHGASFLHSKGTLYDGGTKVGLVMRWPGKLARGRRVASLTSHIDILPSICELLRLEVPHYVQGQSFVPQMMGEQDEGREMVFAGHAYASRMARSQRFKYIRHRVRMCLFDVGMREAVLCPAGPWENQEVLDHYSARRRTEELYDLESDPAELYNVADDPAYAEALQEMRAGLDAHLDQTDDHFRSLYVPDGLQPSEAGWELVRLAKTRDDPNIEALVALGEA